MEILSSLPEIVYQPAKIDRVYDAVRSPIPKTAEDFLEESGRPDYGITSRDRVIL